MKSGASGFLLKDVRPEQLADAVRRSRRGRAAGAVDHARLIEGSSPSSPGPARPTELEELTERELEVLKLVAKGLSNAEIGGQLFVSEATVKTHVTRILAKLSSATASRRSCWRTSLGSCRRAAYPRTDGTPRRCQCSPPNEPPGRSEAGQGEDRPRW